jgi:hypothetical protein
MRASEQLDELAAALSQAQGEFPAIPKDCTAKIKTKSGGEYSFKYADLETILACVRPVLAKHGLSLLCDVVLNLSQTGDGGRAMVATVRLLHSSGQWVESSPLAIPIEPDSYQRQPAQACGSSATYATRYAIEALLAIRASEDDDGAAASGNHIERQQAKPKPERKPEPKPEPKPPAKTLDPDLAEILRGFGWVAERRQINADTLLAMFGCTLAECVLSDGVAQAAVISIQRWLTECDGDTHERRLSMLWNAALMEQDLNKEKPNNG